MLVTAEMVYRMFPPTSLNTLSNIIDSPSFSAQDFINEQLQQVFLPFPLSLLHLLPRWILVTGITIIITLLIKIFLDPAISICNLCRASSMSILDRITTIFVPSVSILRRHQRAAAIELGGEYPLEQLRKDQDTRFDALEKDVGHIFHTQLKIQALLKKMENRAEIQDVKTLNSEIQNLSALISESKRGNQ